MIVDASRNHDWLPRAIAIGAIALAVGGFIVHAAVGFQGVYLSHVSAVWMALARDLADGLFIRDLVSDAGYGGTRYFPLFFALIGLLLKFGAPITWAGWIVGCAALTLLVAGVYRAVRMAGAPALTAGVFAAGAGASYFTQQTIFEIRADVLAAALNVWGITFMLPAWRNEPAGAPRAGAAAVCFTLAFATKITALSIPAAVIAACLFSGRQRLAVRLGALLAGASAVVFAIVQFASSGRAFRVWATCMFGGADSGSTIGGLFSAGFISGLTYSHLILAVAAISLAGLFVIAVRPAMPRALPVSIWVASSATVAVSLSSPGTIATNQVAEWIACSLIVVAIASAGRIGARGPLSLIVASLVVWMSAQDIARAVEHRRQRPADWRLHQARLVDRLRALPAPVFSESALWPILAGREVVVLDPFAARVVFRARDDIENDLIAKIADHRFSAVILDFDPASAEGRGIYQNSHLGSRVMAAIEANYQLEPQVSPEGFVLLPKISSIRIDRSASY